MTTFYAPLPFAMRALIIKKMINPENRSKNFDMNINWHVVETVPCA